MVPVEPVIPNEEPPTLPQKGYSGSTIKLNVVRAMQSALDAEKQAYAALDHLNELLTECQSYPPPPRVQKPPRPNGRYRERIESTA